MLPACIVSGAQTGADRAGLDWAIFHDIPHGGWCPKGRKAEDRVIPPQYQLPETPSASYLQRTVRDSDGTTIFTISAMLADGGAPVFHSHGFLDLLFNHCIFMK